MALLTDQRSRGTGARALWFTCLSSASRTALACSIIAIATLYGPDSLRRHVTFPAFSYVVAILIVTDAAVGDAVRALWLAMFATALTVLPAMGVFWFIGPTKFSNGTVALAVALASAVVALPKTTPLIAKRIALGQIVIIYVVGFIQGVKTDPLMHPVHVAASTALGVAASVCATVLPFPRLASLEVKEKSKIVAEIAATRLGLFVDALTANDTATVAGSISKASSLSSSATKLLRIIKRYQESMQWERLPFKLCRPGWLSSGDRLQDLSTPLKGMELALSTIPSFPVEILQNPKLKNGLKSLEKHIAVALDNANASLPSDLLTFPESDADDIMNAVQSFQTIPETDENLPPLFFVFCMKLLQSKCQPKHQKKPEEKKKNTDENSDVPLKKNGFFSSFCAVLSDLGSEINRKRLVPAVKCAVSLGAAVFLGLVYSKENGFWASLPVAVSFAGGREATFRTANVKIQGTVLGCVYGVLSFVVFEKLLAVRLLCLLPWFVFTSFLQRSKMYGPAGGISAVIGAVLILGRTDFGRPSEFAIARIIELFIGVSSSIMVDILLQQTRASTMAKLQLAASLRYAKTCVDSLSFKTSWTEIEKNRKAMETQAQKMKKFMEEADVEPNFWFSPLHISCYSKLFKSLSKMVDLFTFSAHAMKNIEQNLPITEDSWKKITEKLENDLEKFKKTVDPSITLYADVTALKSVEVLEKKMEETCSDIEMGKPVKPERKLMGFDEMEMEKMVGLFLQHCGEVMEDIGEEDEESEEAKSEAVINLTAIAFCLKGLMNETKEIGEAIRELIQWENPSSNVDFNEIACKLYASLQK